MQIVNKGLQHPYQVKFCLSERSEDRSRSQNCLILLYLKITFPDMIVWYYWALIVQTGYERMFLTVNSRDYVHPDPLGCGSKCGLLNPTSYLPNMMTLWELPRKLHLKQATQVSLIHSALNYSKYGGNQVSRGHFKAIHEMQT